MVIRVKQNKNFTVMSNHHLRNKNLSLAAKGLMSYMLSCVDTWKYTERGLAAMHGCGRQRIRTALGELEDAGYLVRQQGRDKKGRMTKIEYILYEEPPNYPAAETAESSPWSEKPTTEKPAAENHTVRNNNRKNNQKNNNTVEQATREAHSLVKCHGLDEDFVPVVAKFIIQYGLDFVQRTIPYSKSRAKTNLMSYLHTVLEHGTILPESHSTADVEYIPTPMPEEQACDLDNLSPQVQKFLEKHSARHKETLESDKKKVV